MLELAGIVGVGWRMELKLIGEQMNKNVFPTVTDGGIVVPDERPVPLTFQGTEVSEDERERASRPTAGSRKGPQGRKRQAGRTAGAITSIPLRVVRSYFGAEFEKVVKAYPETRVWAQKEGAFLKVPTALLSGLGRRVILLIAVRFSPSPEIRAWGFWEDGKWLGPRHTNSPDGSICPFDASNPTWWIGQPLIRLIDIYSVWALRHLHLEVFGRWPGRQLALDPFERLAELFPDELCGCDNGIGKRYVDCCLTRDKATFIAKMVRSVPPRIPPYRAPPHNVAAFVTGGGEAPDLDAVLPPSPTK